MILEAVELDAQDDAPLDAPPPHLGWQEHGLCRGVEPELFYPERGASTTEAQDVCRSCAVRVECITYSVGEKYGIWGGTSERQRRVLRKYVGVEILEMPRERIEEILAAVDRQRAGRAPGPSPLLKVLGVDAVEDEGDDDE